MNYLFYFGAMSGNAKVRYSQGRRVKCEYRGRWVSHTGYKHSISSIDAHGKSIFDHVAQGAWSLYHDNASLPYLVGRGDCDLWSDIRVNAQQQYTIRLPAWAGQAITDALCALGYQIFDQLNHLWVAPEIYTYPQIKHQLSALRSTGSRLRDESDLALALLRQHHGSPQWFAQHQLDLFSPEAQLKSVQSIGGK